MKMMTAVKASMITAALGVACLLPATARAQSEIAPDYFAFSAEEAAATAQPVRAEQAKADFQGQVSLPYDVTCNGKNLKAGQYLLSVKSDGTNRVVTLKGDGQAVKINVRAVPANRVAVHSAVLVRKSANGRKLEAVYVENLNSTLYVKTSSAGTQAPVEQLPIS
jgi:hypothetical protein